MEFDDIRAVWTAETGGDMAAADEALIRTVVERDRTLAQRVRVRDFLELAVAVGMAVAFGWMALQSPVAWPWWLAAVITLGVGAVFVRERGRRTATSSEGTQLRAGLRLTLAEVDHQIRLLRSVAWWYLLPLALVAGLVVTGAVLGVAREVSPDDVERTRRGLGIVLALSAAVVAPVFGFVWWLNMRAVRVHLLPHREQLVEALRQVDANGEDA